MPVPEALHELRRPLTVTVHGEMGLVDGEVVAIGARELRFWCREDLFEGTRHDLRVDLGPGEGNADLEVVIRIQEGPWSGRGRGFGHVGRWTGNSPDQRRRLLGVVQSQLPDVWIDAAPPPAHPVAPPAPHAGSSSMADARGYSVMVAPGPTPTVAVTLSDDQAVRVALRVRDGRAVVRVAGAEGLGPGDRILLVMSLPDGTFQQHPAVIARSRSGQFARTDALDSAARRHLERVIRAAGVKR